MRDPSSNVGPGRPSLPLGAGRAAVLLAVALTPAAGSLPRAAATPVAAAPPTARASTYARILVASPVRSRPRDGARRVYLARPVSERGRAPLQLLVVGSATSADGRQWLQVLLPRRPNGRTGWIEAVRTELSSNPYRVRVRLRPRTVTVYRDGRRLWSTRAVIGEPRSPTPIGTFALYEAVRQPAGSFLGSYALHLTAHSETLRRYDGGDGRVAIHGRGGASYDDRLGSARSHGCVRIDNREVTWMARRLPAGTPVEVTR